jgi:triacylglycerol lipase
MTGWRPGRRAVLAGAASLWPALALGQQRRLPTVDPGPPPIVFVHGNGDSSAVWINNIWRFESSGVPRDRLFAIDFAYPVARTDDSKPEPNRSSTDDQFRELAAFVAQVHKTTKQRRVALVAASRGGYAVRNYLKNGGGAELVSHAVLCGTPNRGIVASDSLLVGSEFNGASPFLTDLNAGPDDVVTGVEMMAIRSDKNDKDAQPDARFVGAPGKPTGVSHDTAELRGAKNVILDGLDQREVAFHKLAFAAQYEFILGKPAPTLFIAQEPLPVLNGRVTGIAGDLYTNLSVPDAEVEIYEVDQKTGERRSPQPIHRKTTGGDGRWGPFIGRSDMHYEFVLRMSGHPITHVFRPPFLRSSEVIHLRPVRFAKGDEAAGAVVVMSRPRGYFGVGRDKFSLDGKVPPGINDGVPGTSTGRLAFEPTPRTVVAMLNNETIPVRTFPVKENHIVVAEFMN